MNINNQIDKYKGFKLLSLDLRGNSLMGKNNLYYNFVEENDNTDYIYTTVIIGSNGTGKSNLFRIVIELFKELYDLSIGKKRSYKVDGLFNLKYSLGGDIYEYANFKDKDFVFNANNLPKFDIKNSQKSIAFLIVNGIIQGDFNSAFFPLSIVANSIMITDKFPYYRKDYDEKNEKIDGFPIYKYLGVKNTPQSASPRAYIRKTVGFIVEQFEKEKSSISAFIATLKRAINFLELDNSLEIYYHTSNNAIFFKGNLTVEKLENYFESINKNYLITTKKAPFKNDHFLKIKNEPNLLESICDFCNQLVDNNRLETIPNRKTSIRKITYNIIESIHRERLSNEYKMLEKLRKLGIISPPEILLKRGENFSLQESSSGEYQFFASIVGLIATIKPTNSLVLIDEPEISLHPNWQMKYFSFIRELFSHPEFATCHILVATHSHFLISDLKGGSSKIIGLKREGKEIKIIDLPKELDTFGWSAENILLNIFNVPTTRNYYIAQRIGIILKKAALQSNLNEYQEELMTYRSGLKEEDPLHYTITKIAEKLKWLD